MGEEKSFTCLLQILIRGSNAVSILGTHSVTVPLDTISFIFYPPSYLNSYIITAPYQHVLSSSQKIYNKVAANITNVWGIQYTCPMTSF